MEFPGNCLTNVLKIENHSTIHYSIYTATLESDPQDADTSESTYFHTYLTTPSSNPSTRVTYKNHKGLLRKVEKLCRDRGANVTLRLDKLELWLFESVGDTTAADGGQNGGRSRLDISALSSEGVSLRETSSGTFRSSTLEKRAPNSTVRKQGTPASSAFEPNGRTTQSVGAKAVLANASLGTHPPGPPPSVSTPADVSGKLQQQEDDSLLPYHLFITATLSTITYRLARYHRYIPFDIRTLVPPHPFKSITNDESEYLLPHSSSIKFSPTLMVLDARLTTTGTLLITSSTVHQKALSLLAPTASDPIDQSPQPGETTIWLAPGGTLGTYLGPHAISDTWTEDDTYSHEEERERARERLARKEVELRWKSGVTEWLAEKGLNMLDWESSGGWVRVQIWAADTERAGGEDADVALIPPDKDVPMSILWPAALCFWRATLGGPTDHRIGASNGPADQDISLDNQPLSHEEADQTAFSGLFSSGHISPAAGNITAAIDTGLEWFRSPEDGGVQDPLAFAERWYLDKKRRDEKLDAKRKSREEELLRQEALTAAAAEEERSRREAEKVAKSVVVPSARKASIAGDLQPVGGVYPTPPDGVHPQGPASVPSLGAPGSAPGSVQLSGAEGSFAGATAPNDTAEIDTDLFGPEGGGDSSVAGTRKANMMMSDLGIPRSSLNPGGRADIAGMGDVDLYGGLDDGIFGETEITEADFSFFDEPDLGGDGGQDLDLMDTGDGIPIDGTDNNMGSGIADGGHLLNLMPENSAAEGTESRTVDHFTGAELNLADFDIDQLMKDVTGGSPSQLADESKANNRGHDGSSPVLTPGIGAKEVLKYESTDDHIVSPPLSPEAIKKKLLPNSEVAIESATLPPHRGDPALPGRRSDPPKRRQSRFSPVTFNPSLGDSDNKYMSQGRFWFASGTEEEMNRGAETERGAKSDAIPLIGLPKRKRKTNADATVIQQGDFLHGADEPTAAARDDNNHGSETDPEDGEKESSESDISDDDDTTEEELPQNFTAGVKRKREMEDDGDVEMASSLQRLAFEPVVEKERLDDLAPPPWDCLEPDASSDWPLAGVFTTKENPSEGVLQLASKEFIGVGQILADQLISGTLGPLKPYSSSPDSKEEDVVAVQRSQDEINTAEAVMETFTGATQCNLNSYAIVEDAPPETPLVTRNSMRPIPQPKRTNSTLKSEVAASSSSNYIFKIPPPHLQVQRAENPLQVLPPALYFWETFGFGPCSGSKDVIAFCVHPSGEGVKESAGVFLDKISSVYESCRFGSHVRGEVDKFKEGLVAVRLLDTSAGADVEAAVRTVKDTCVQLGECLSKISAELQNIVIYLVNPFRHPNALVDLCTAFSELFQAYVYSPEIQQSMNINEVVLQIVPIDFIASKTSLVSPTQIQYTRLALEVYERCAQTDPDKISIFPPTTHAPSILLAQPPPKTIDFKLTSEPSPSLLRENSVLHIGYSQSMDERWVSVAWTDMRGDIQSSVSYCLGRKNADTLRPFEEVAKEIWETTLEITEIRKVHWRLMLVKAGVMGREEIDMWTALSNQPTNNNLTTLTLIAVDTCPSLSLHCGLSPFVPSSFNPQAAMYTTPVSTPQPSTQSPDQFGTTATPATPSGSAPTPGAATTSSAAAPEAPLELDTDATLVDLSDETWGVILSHRLQDSHSITRFHPALASGYLVKRTGSTREREDPPVVMSVNLLHAQRTLEPLLREILGMYRDLGTLARLKGVVDPVKSVVPWHVAAAVKAQEGLSFLM
ncbi:MAG: mediator of RNA polymerase II transcription subunit 13 [Geoglossum umbratile]|nr:MAG: mediator of RNA polymerase II transcription subunit 13 [Geoglossum umbratile]